jgi:hypothetical protein
VRNYGEIAGGALYFAAEGAWAEAPSSSSSSRCPKDFDVQVSSGGLSVLGTRVPLPIRGAGLLRVLYADADLRVVASPTDSPDKWEERGLVAVQMPMSALEPGWRPAYDDAAPAAASS